MTRGAFSLSNYSVVMTDGPFDDCLIEAEILARIGATIQRFQTYDAEKVIEITREANGIICDYAPFNRQVISSLKKAKGIVVAGVGFDNIDLEAASEKGIVVCNTPNYMSYEVPEHAVALILSLTRKISAANLGSKSGEWSRFGEKYWSKLTPIFHLDGKTVGIIGLGRLGKKVAKRLSAFDTKVIAYDPYVSEEAMRASGVQRTDLDTLLRESDVISINACLTDETFHMIGARELSLMKETAILVNTARGKIIDQEALVKALASKRIAGAGLDVLEREPPDPNEEILKLDNVIITPHMAAFSEKTATEIRRLAAEEMVRILLGKTPLHALNHPSR
jgi:D-3-phosphoglycerate dehydrogenase / 2-oxoglutarate reductase